MKGNKRGKTLPPLVYIVIAIHNRVELTLKLLSSLKTQTYPHYKIVIVDDGSTDNSSQEIRDHYPSVEIIEGDGDLWWSEATNLGIKHAIKKKAEHVLILNNDNIVDKNLVRELVNASTLHKDTIFSSKVFFQNSKELFFAGGKMDGFRSYPFCNMTPFGKKENKNYYTFREIDCGIGMGLFIPTKLFKVVGFFNSTNLPQYYSDFEFTLRAKKKGYTLLFCPTAVLWNNKHETWHISRSVRRALFHKGSLFYFPAVLYYTWNYYPQVLFPAFITIYLSRVLLKIFKHLWTTQR